MASKKLDKSHHLPIKITPRSQKQADYLETINTNHITFCVGPAGCGKTFLACLQAASDLMDRRVGKIVLVRPSVTAGEDIGFLPGTLEEKMDPFMAPLYDAFNEYWQDEAITDMIKDKTIEIVPLAFMRGRAEPISSLLPTPTGFRRMGDLKVGDLVYGSDGKPTEVTGVFPQGVRPVVDVVFNDKTTIRCSRDHLWNTRTQSQRNRDQPFTAKTAAEIQSTVRNKHGQKNHEIPVVSGPVEMARTEVPVDPYLLGCLLGDGTISSGSIHFTTADTEMVEELSRRLPEGVTIKKDPNSKTTYDYLIVKSESCTGRNPLKSSLKTLGVWGHRASEKFIPSCYLYNDVATRVSILRGLMDTDGSVFDHKSGKTRVEFYSTSLQLSKDMKILVESLGGTCKVHKREVAGTVSSSGIRHNFDILVTNILLPESINPFLLTRKSSKFLPSPVLRLISDVLEAGEEECQCISVSAEDHLYLTNNFVVTHNTFRDSFIIADEAQNITKDQMKMLLTRFGDGCRMLIAGDMSQSDLDGSVQNGLTAGLLLSEHGVEGMSSFQFDINDVVRHQVVKDVLEVWDRLRLG